MDNILMAFISVLLVGLVSLIGVFTIALGEKRLQTLIYFFVSFSVGALIGSAFLHLLPDVVNEMGFTIPVSVAILSGFLMFFVLEKFIHWRHCHQLGGCDVHDAHEVHSDKHPRSLGIMNLIGGGFHNLLDGLLIGASYLASVEVGIATTVAVIMHEIPQEMGDFGVLLHAGFSKGRALVFNFLSAMVAVVGVGLSLAFGALFQGYVPYLVGITAGGFLYIAGSDLIPELMKENSVKKIGLQFLGILMGLVVMYLFTFLNVG